MKVLKWLLIWVFVVVGNELVFYSDDKILLYSMLLALIMIKQLSGKLLWKDFSLIGLNIKEEFLYYEYLTRSLNLIAKEIIDRVLKVRKVFLVLNSNLKVLNSLLLKYSKYSLLTQVVFNRLSLVNSNEV